MPSPGIHYPPPLIFVVVFALGGIINGYVPISLAGIENTIVGKMVAFTLCVAGFGFLFASIVIFLKRRTPVYPNSAATSLVTSGPYQFSRNPMYAGLCLLYVAGAIFLNSLWPLLFLPLVIWFVTRFIIAREEDHLLEQFGSAYSEYQSRVRRWM